MRRHGRSFLLVLALLSSSAFPASNIPRTAAPLLLALAQNATRFLSESASQQAEALFSAWAEAYGLAGDSVLPPSAVALPPGVPPAPHLEECARVTQAREAWEQRGTGGEEPDWTRGAPRKGEAAGAAAAGGSPGCKGKAQEQGEGVPQPPWIRGSDSANLPLTRVVQRDIWRHQFPPGDCRNRRLLIANWAKTHAHGVGSQIHYMSALLSVAITFNRTLVDRPDGLDRARIPSCEAAGHNSQWECFFVPLASSACRHVAQLALLQNPDKIPESGMGYRGLVAQEDQIVAVGYPNPNQLAMEAGAADRWGDAFLRSPCSVELDGRLVNLTDDQRKVHWWRAQGARFMMRWPSAHLCHVTNQERHRAFGMLAANHVARFLQSQSEALSALSTGRTSAGGTTAASSIAAAAADWESRRRRALERLVSVANSSLSFQPDAAAAAAAASPGGAAARDVSWSLGLEEPFMPRPIVSLHVRGTDKYAEMGLTSLDSHIFYMNRLRRHAVDLWHVWLNTETQANIDRVGDYKPWNFFYSSNARQQEKSTSINQYEREQSVAVSFASVLIAAQCDYFVGSLGSNWSRLMNELRSTNGRLLSGFVAVNYEEW